MILFLLLLAESSCNEKLEGELNSFHYIAVAPYSVQKTMSKVLLQHAVIISGFKQFKLGANFSANMAEILKPRSIDVDKLQGKTPHLTLTNKKPRS